MPGRAEGSAGSGQGLAPEIPFVQKPFTPGALLQTVGEGHSLA
jgi:hypothetical protein